MEGTVDILLGLQWGDEGKGKLVDVLAPKYDVIARFQGGPNAGHTLEFEGQKHVLHTIPSGIFHTHIKNLIGNGVVLDPKAFVKEILLLEKVDPTNIRERIILSKKTHLILPTHILLDRASEKVKGEGKIGSTLKGIGPCYTDKTGRNGIRVGDVFTNDFDQKYKTLKETHLKLIQSMGIDINDLLTEDESLKSMETDFLVCVSDYVAHFQIVDCEYYLNEALKSGKRVLAEGAQGTLLDIDFGSYPFVTSSNTIAAGACTGLGIAPNKIGEVIGVFKAYCTRVGSGPFPSELSDETGKLIQSKGNETGSTTGRKRRTGWLDLPLLRYACMLNGVTQLVITKADVLSDDFSLIKLVERYVQKLNRISDDIPYDLLDVFPRYQHFKGWGSLKECPTRADMPREFQEYLTYIENYVKTPITYISTGPNRTELICVPVQEETA